MARRWMARRWTTLAGAALLAMMASGASALCPVPAISNDATVIKFRSGTAGESEGAIGTKATVVARTEGALYYDAASKSLKLCDGSQWRDVKADIAGATGSGTGGGMAVGDIQAITWNFTNSHATNSKTVNLSLPVDPEASYVLHATVSGIGKEGTCSVSLKATGKTPKLLVSTNNNYDKEDGSDTASGRASWGLVSKNPAQKAFSYDNRTAVYTGDTGASWTYMSALGTLNWDGAVSVTVNAAYNYTDSRGDRAQSDSGCSGELKILRVS